MLLRRSYKIAGFGVAGLASIFAIDNMYYYSTLIRSFRTFWVAGSVALDYKLNFKPSKVNLDGMGSSQYSFDSFSFQTCHLRVNRKAMRHSAHLFQWTMRSSDSTHAPRTRSTTCAARTAVSTSNSDSKCMLEMNALTRHDFGFDFCLRA